MDHGRTVPVYGAGELAALPDHPIILRGFRPRASCDSLEALLALSGTKAVQGYQLNGGDDWTAMPAAEAVAAFASGQLDINVVDLPIADADDPGERLDVPAVLSDGNLLLLLADWAVSRRSLVVTQAGQSTAMHVDSCGFGGWMYLFAGCKHWTLWDAAAAPMFYDLLGERYFDAASGHPHPVPGCAAALAAVPFWRGEIGAGDLLWFPEGWLHRVDTVADSFGYGGSTLHAARAGQAVQAWLWERRLGFSQTADLTEVLRAALGTDQGLGVLIDRAQAKLAGWTRSGVAGHS